MDGSISGPIKIKRSRPVLVADEIKEWVVKKDLKSGDKLPNESEMTVSYTHLTLPTICSV